jgi:hypothetical protein
VIQSAADGIDQSLVRAGAVDALDVDALDPDPSPPFFAASDEPEPDDPASDDADLSAPTEAGSDAPSSDADDDDDLTALRRSFLAQPEPLKWMAGAANALRTGPPPHSGQVVGGSAWTPCMTSKRWPHAAQW